MGTGVPISWGSPYRAYNGFPLLADLNIRTPPGFFTMLQLKYNNGSTGIATIESSSLSVPGVDAGKQHPVGCAAMDLKW